MSDSAVVVVLVALFGSSVLVLGVLWLISLRRRGKTPPPPATVASPASTPPRPFTMADARAIYSHFLATIGWTLFWFSGIGGAAGVILYNSTTNRLDYPLVIVAVVSWGSIGAAVAVATRADLRKLRR